MTEENIEINREVLKPVMEPDLNGITHVLGLISENEKLENYNYDEFIGLSNKKLTISKINPNVNSFVPQSLNLPSNSHTTSETNHCTKMYHSITPQKGHLKTTEKENKYSLCNVLKLKNKIIKALESDDPLDKFERNVSIAALMRLYATKPKLDSNVSQKSNVSLSTQQHSALLENDGLNEKLSDGAIESIRKVNDWMQDGNKTMKTVTVGKVPTVVLDAVTFRKKVSNFRENASAPPKMDENNFEYMPSQHAVDLLRKYQDREKLVDNAKDDIWTKLEKELKRKDNISKQNKKSKRRGT